MCNNELNKPGAFPYEALYINKMVMVLFYLNHIREKI